MRPKPCAGLPRRASALSKRKRIDTLTKHAVVLAEEGDEEAFKGGVLYGFTLGVLVGQRED
jgi:hypothetical protein